MSRCVRRVNVVRRCRIGVGTRTALRLDEITTERSVVYLMGRVTAREAARATELISGTTGVQRVVRILETISEDEMMRLSTTPSKEATKQ